MSPHLKPTEHLHVWGHSKTETAKHSVTHDEVLCKLVESMPAQEHAVIKVNGGHNN